jgi:serine/threonine protein kinase
VETVEAVCNQLARSRLLAPEAVRTIHKRWRNEAQDSAGDTERFSKWLVSNGFLTDFQVGVLVRGFADLLFLDDYKLIERIGQGRMAGVYKAIHKFGQVVAVKVLPASKAKHAPTAARFQREARMAVRLQHVNVVRTFQVGKTKGGLQYLVMEYLDGETLEDVVQRRGKLPVAEALHVVTQALAGLAHVDAQGLVHRDLKPGNLMLVPAPQETVLKSVVKILDIGLGRTLFDEGLPGDNSGDLTSAGAILGTPLYMAPEQARDAHAADIRADIYSLGCVLYFALTGQPPFPDNSVVRVIVRQATEPARPLRDFVEVPPRLQEVMDKLLAKDPAERFAKPAAALKALEALQPSRPVPAPESDPKLRSYLTWLKQAPPPPEEGDPAPPAVPVAQPFAPPPLREKESPFENLTMIAPAPKRSRWRLTLRDLLAVALGALLLLVLEAVLFLGWWIFF